MSKLTIALLALALGAGGVQFFQPSFENPPVAQAATFEAVAKPPAQVAEILNRSCGDCHSHNTRYPWYAKVAPASWLLDHDIRTGRAHLNFSTWNYSGEMSKLRMAEVCDVIRNGKMPDSKYLLLHPEAALSEADKAAVCAFVPAD
jgi:hypothetical protein